MRSRQAKQSSKEAQAKAHQKRIKISWFFIAITGLLTITPISSTTKKYKFLRSQWVHSNRIESQICRTSTETSITSLWFKETTPISFNTQGSITATQFISDENNVKQYSMLERGSTCHMPSSTYTGWIFLSLVIEKHPTTPNACQVTRIITTSHLEPCSGTPPSVETLLSFGSGTYDSVLKGSAIRFDRNNFHTRVIKIKVYTLSSSFTFNSVDEEFMELLLLKDQSGKSQTLHNTFDITRIEPLRTGYYDYQNRRKVFTAGEFVRKNIVDGLRGFHLNPDPADPFGTFMVRRTFSNSRDMTRSITFQFYLSKARLMTANDVYLVKMKTKKIKENDPGFTFKEFEYDLKVERDVSNNLFKLTLIRHINSPQSDQTVLLIPYRGVNDDWIHFGVSIGYGVLYFTSPTQGKFKRTESLHAWVSGTAYHQEMTMLEDDTTEALYTGAYSGDRVRMYYIVSAQAFSDSGMTASKTTNDFGLRVWEADTGLGSYTQSKITTETTTDGRCFLQGLVQNQCQFYAFLTNSNDINPNSQRFTTIGPAEPTCKPSRCRYCISNQHCAFTLPGVNEDLYQHFGLISISDYEEGTLYDPTKSVQVSHFIKFTNNLGRDYFVRCPICCKTFDENLECIECFGTSTLTQTHPSYARCSCSIKDCAACETPSRCRYCQVGKVSAPSISNPNVDDCSRNKCPTGLGFADALKARCQGCIYQGCKTCDFSEDEDGGCSECSTAGFKAIDYSLSNFVVPGDPNYGEKKCIDSSTVVDGFYQDGSNYYRKCPKNCKVCSDGGTCQVCGTPAGSSASWYLVDSESPHRCTECLVENNEYLTEQNPARCVVCPPGQRLMKGGVSSSDCDTCDASRGKFINSEGYCDYCSSDCSECDSKNECLRCKNLGENVQPDGTCAVGCPQNYSPDSNRVCKLICPINQILMKGGKSSADCDPCGSNSGKFVDQDGYCDYCRPGCSECSNRSSCSKCANPSYTAQRDGRCELETKNQPGKISPPKENPGTPTKPPSLGESSAPLSGSSQLEIVDKKYLDSSSLVRLKFNTPIISSMTVSDIKTQLMTNNKNSQKSREVKTTLKKVQLEQNERHLKIYLTIEENIEDEVLRIELNNHKEKIIKKKDPSLGLTTGSIEISPISHYRARGQEKAVSTASKAISYSASVLGFLSLFTSSSSIFELIKSFQMIDFLIFLNIDHPSNLSTFLEELEFSLVDSLPNPFKNLRDSLCSIDKEKFEEEDVTCYILLDQGRYFTIVLSVFCFYLLGGLIAFKIEFIKKILKKRMNLVFWVEFLEGIRMDLLISTFLSLEKVSLIERNFWSYYSLNVLISGIFFTLNMISTAYQFYAIRKAYSGYQKRREIERRESKGLSRQFHVQGVNIQDPNDSIHQMIVTNNSRLENSRILLPVINITKRRLEQKTKGLSVSPTSEFNQENKTGCFYQRHHRPLIAIKDLFISFILVFGYNSPVIQTTGITLILGIFLGLDFYYRPAWNITENINLLLSGSLFFLLSLSLTIFSFFHSRLSRKMAFYVVGYTSILVLSLMVLKSLAKAIQSLFGALKWLFQHFLTKKSRNKVHNKPQREDKKTENQARETSDGLGGIKKPHTERPQPRKTREFRDNTNPQIRDNENPPDERRIDVNRIHQNPKGKKYGRRRMGRGGFPRTLNYGKRRR